MAGIHRETAADGRRTGSAVLAGAEPRRGARAALRKLRLVPVSEHAVLPAVPVGDIRMACGRADWHHRDVVHFPSTLLRRSWRAVHGDPGATRLRRPAVLQSSRSRGRLAPHRDAGRGRVRGRHVGRDPVEVQAAEGTPMKAMVVRAPGGTDVLKIEQIPDPTPGPKDVVIKIDACGVCFHDVVTRNGTLKFGVQMPCILGHEISGTVVEVGHDVRGFRKNDRVATVQRYHICGACRYCRGGREPLCPDRKFTGDWGLVGGYAAYVAIEDDNVGLVPEEEPLQRASS